MNSPSHRHPSPGSGLVERQIHRWDRIAEALRHRPGQDREAHAAARPVITISGAAGSGRMLLAESLAHSLNYEIYGRELVEKAATDLGLNRPIVDGLDERVDSEIRLQLATWMRGHEIESSDYIHSLARVIVGLARSGGAIILGRGSSFILQDVTDRAGASIRLEAPLAVCVKRLMELRKISEKDALRIAEHSETEQKQFIRRYFHQDISSPLAYDLVINTGRLNIENAAQVVLECLRAKGYNVDKLKS